MLQEARNVRRSFRFRVSGTTLEVTRMGVEMKGFPVWQPAASISEWQNHGKIRQQWPRRGDFSLSFQQLLTVSKRKDAVCKGAGTFVPVTAKETYFSCYFFVLVHVFSIMSSLPTTTAISSHGMGS